MKKEKKIVGWREWVNLPLINIPWIKAKLDTGARTSSIHAINMEIFQKDKKEWVKFQVHPKQRSEAETVTIEAEVYDHRIIKSSNGHQSIRPVIKTQVVLLGECCEIELTLADRDSMGFRMLLGREGIRRRFLVDAGKSYYSEKPVKKIKKGNI